MRRTFSRRMGVSPTEYPRRLDRHGDGRGDWPGRWCSPPQSQAPRIRTEIQRISTYVSAGACGSNVCSYRISSAGAVIWKGSAPRFHLKLPRLGPLALWLWRSVSAPPWCRCRRQLQRIPTDHPVRMNRDRPPARPRPPSNPGRARMLPVPPRPQERSRGRIPGSGRGRRRALRLGRRDPDSRRAVRQKRTPPGRTRTFPRPRYPAAQAGWRRRLPRVRFNPRRWPIRRAPVARHRLRLCPRWLCPRWRLWTPASRAVRSRGRAGGRSRTS